MAKYKATLGIGGTYCFHGVIYENGKTVEVTENVKNQLERYAIVPQTSQVGGLVKTTSVCRFDFVKIEEEADEEFEEAADAEPAEIVEEASGKRPRVKRNL